jgi:thermitase
MILISLSAWYSGIVIARRIVVLLLVSAGASAGDSFRLSGDRLTAVIDSEPVHTFLKRFAEEGVTVHADPAVSGRVSLHVESADLESALDDVLRSYSYALMWDRIEGPLGPVVRLSEMNVFRPGHREEVRPLQTRRSLEFTTGPGGGPPFVRDEMLIGFKPGVSRREALRLLDQIGASILESLPNLGLYRVTLPKGSNVPALVELATSSPLTARAEPNYGVSLGPTLPPMGAAGDDSDDGLPQGAVRVAVLDSGLDPDAVGTSVLYSYYDALEPGNSAADAVGHGTRMSLIASGLYNPSGIGDAIGSAPSIVSVRAFDETGKSSYFDLMRGISHAIASGARVINLSWGAEGDSSFLRSAIREAADSGLLVIAAAGNEPTGNPVYPAAYPETIAVGATTEDGLPWDQSNFGSWVTAAAPGFVTFPGGSYAGTSVSSAFFSQIAARAFEKYPDKSAGEIRALLMDSLTPRPSDDPGRSDGVGVLDSTALERILR